MKDIVQSIINSGKMGSMVITGGGISAIAELLKYGGGSKFLIAGIVPYNQHYIKHYTGKDKDFVSLAACRELVFWAGDESYRALRLSYGGISPENLVSIGVTAKLTYDGEREGREHEAYIGFQSFKPNNMVDKIENYRWTPQFKQMDRQTQEQDLTNSIITYLADFIDVKNLGCSWPNMELLTLG